MVVKVNISMDEWLFSELENRRGQKNRSEYISETIAKGLGFHSKEVVSNDSGNNS